MKTMTDNNNPTEVPPSPAGSDEAQQEAAQTSDTKAEAATRTATVGDELSEDDLEAVAGGASLPNGRRL
jgi:hypothetical protein